MPSADVHASLSQPALDEARLDILRQRVVIFGLVLGLMLLAFGGFATTVFLGMDPATRRPSLGMVLLGPAVGLLLVVLPWVRRHRFARALLRSLVWRTQLIVIFSVIGQAGVALAVMTAVTADLTAGGFEGTLGPGWVLLPLMGAVHFAAAIIVPWTVAEAAVAPVVWALLVLAGPLLGSRDSASSVAISSAVILLTAAPGIAIASLRSEGIRTALGLRLLNARIADVERELTLARRVHERLFPVAITDGPVRVGFAYEPMRQIGGDFLDVVRRPDGGVLLLIVDVTGHGIAAALAVNRLHGEVRRVLGQARDVSARDMIAALNEYVRLTLAPESVFATAAAVVVGVDGTVDICVAGHPRPLVRRSDGRVEAVEPTAPMLGILGHEDFDAEETRLSLADGSTLLLYTDGVIEMRNAAGEEFRQAGLERALAAASEEGAVRPGVAQPGIAQQLLAAAASFRASAPEDDVLFATVRCGP